MNIDVQTQHEPEALDVVWGVAAIAKVVNRTERQAAYLLRTGKLPGKKKGKLWTSTVTALRNALCEVI